MRTIDSTSPHPATTQHAGGPSRGSGDVPARRSPRHIAEAVMASYIQDISQASRRSPGRRDGQSTMPQPA
jgi:hypothetical protein